MKFYGKFLKELYKDYKTGMTLFSAYTESEEVPLDPKYNTVLCKGFIGDLPKNTPIEVSGIYISRDKPFVLVEDVTLVSKDDSISLQFLKENNFAGVGDRISVKIIEKIDGDIFSFCKKDNAIEILSSIQGFSKSNAIDFVHKINKFSDMQKLAKYIVSHGGTFSSAENIYEMYEENSLEEIRKNPYLLQYAGISFDVCEKISLEVGVNQISNVRISAIVYAAISSIESKGNTCCTINDFLDACYFIESNAGIFSKTPSISLMSYIFSNKNDFVFYKMNGEIFLYKKKTFELEQQSARHIVRLDNSKEKFPFELIDIDEIQKTLDIKYGDEQIESFNILKSSGVKILTGGPGRGKSTVVNGILMAYRQMFPNRKISLCAPTGTAAKKLETITGEDTFTIHKLLDVKPFTKDEFIFKNEHDPLDSDFIIVDESSMIDIRLFMMILSATKSGALILFVGDENQLPSVGSGNVLRDMIGSSHFETYKLTKVYRQSANSTIILNADKINKGDINLVSDDTFQIIDAGNAENLKKIAIEKVKENKKDYKDIKVYTPVKKKDYSYSTYELNIEMREVYGSKDKDFFIFDDVCFYVGDIVFMNRNNYDIGYMNGEEGKILSITKENNKYIIEIQKKSDNDIFEISGKNLADMDLGYSMTIHKSQGGECDMAIIIVPKKPYSLMERSLLYVAVTRARKKTIIITEGDALNMAILRNKSNSRVTGLNSQIKVIANQYKNIAR